MPGLAPTTRTDVPGKGVRVGELHVVPVGCLPGEAAPQSALLSRHRRRQHSMPAGEFPAPRTVTKIACCYGFTHMGRFAAEYRTRYGLVPPRETLRG